MQEFFDRESHIADRKMIACDGPELHTPGILHDPLRHQKNDGHERATASDLEHLTNGGCGRVDYLPRPKESDRRLSPCRLDGRGPDRRRRGMIAVRI